MSEHALVCNGCNARLVTDKDLHSRIHEGCRRFGLWVEEGRALIPAKRLLSARHRPPPVSRRPQNIQRPAKPLVDYQRGDVVIVHSPYAKQPYRGVIIGAGYSVGQWRVKEIKQGTVEIINNEFIERAE